VNATLTAPRPSYQRRLTLVVARALTATLVAALTAVLPAAVSGATTEPTASLSGVSCASTTFCVAVGTLSNAAGLRVALVETWNGHHWSRMTLTPPAGSTSSVLYGISCPLTTVCTAVGSRYAGRTGAALVERWDGSKWQQQSVPAEAGATSVVLLAVSCATASSCASTGEYFTSAGYTALAAAYQGAAWKLVAVHIPADGAPSSLDSVSCNPAFCSAVGYYFNRKVSNYSLSLAENLTGAKAVAEHVPPAADATEGAELQAVTCRSASTCEAVGIGSTKASAVALAYGWSSRGWSEQALPETPASLDAVSCPTTAVCVATGQTELNPSSTLADRWTGSKWVGQPTTDPSAATDRLLSGVSCPSTGICVAVGSYLTGASQHPWSELWNGTKWVTVATVTA
jgi:hypothetical protein